MGLTVLSVAYPLAPVSADSTGGAEQILCAIDRGLAAAAHRSLVIAPELSRVTGELLTIPGPIGALDEAAKRSAQAATRRAIDDLLAREPVDLVHLHGIDFPAYLPGPGTPVLATLHLPPAWYPAQALRPTRPDTWVHCVSLTQHEACPPSPALLPPIENGIPTKALRANHAKRSFALYLGRICPEKGVHLAIEAARAAGRGLIIAGEVYRYAEHQRYFDEAIRPNLGAGCRFVGPVGFRRKRRLLTAAACLLVPSLAAETSSLVAREAAACGTAVIAFPNGAMAETVAHGRTGLLVKDTAGMAAAISSCAAIDPDECRSVADARFSDVAMIASYLALYGRLARRTLDQTG